MSKPGSDSTSGQISNFGKSSTSPANSQRKSPGTVGGAAVIGSNTNSKPKVPGAAGTTESKVKTGYMPTRTSSAPPEESKHDGPKFVPTKTHGALNTTGEVTLSYRAAVKSNIPEPAPVAPAAVEAPKAPEAAPILTAPSNAPPALNVALSSISEGNSDYQSEPATTSTDGTQRAVANGLPDSAGYGNEQRPYQQGNNENREYNRDGRRGGRGRGGGGRDYNNQGGSYRSGRGNPQQAAPALTTPNMNNQTYDPRYTQQQQQQQQYYTAQQQQQQQMQQQGYGQLVIYPTAQPGVFSVLTQTGYIQMTQEQIAVYQQQLYSYYYQLQQQHQYQQQQQGYAATGYTPQQMGQYHQQQQQAVQYQGYYHMAQVDNTMPINQEQQIQPEMHQQMPQVAGQSPAMGSTLAPAQEFIPAAPTMAPPVPVQENAPAPPTMTSPPANVPEPSVASAVEAPATETAVAASQPLPVVPKKVLSVKSKDGKEFDATKFKEEKEKLAALAAAAAKPAGSEEAKKADDPNTVQASEVVARLPEPSVSSDNGSSEAVATAPAATTTTAAGPPGFANKPSAGPSIPSLPVSVAPKVTKKKEEESTLLVQPQAEEKIDETKSWEDDSSEPTLPAIVASRRLAPQGSKPVVSTSTAKSTGTRRYSRQDLLEMRPENPEKLQIYSQGVSSSGGDGGERTSGRGGGGGDRGSQWGKQPSERSGNRGDRGAGERGESFRGDRENRQMNRGDNGGGNEDRSGWSKGMALPQSQQKSGNKGPAAPPAKKEVTDPLERLSLEITTQLNKITKENFEKVSKQILDIKLQNTSELDLLVKLIFEKAVQEPTFSEVYANLCQFLKDNANEWSFYMLVTVLGKDEFFWIKDFAFPDEMDSAGPFFSRQEAIEAVTEAPMKQNPGISFDRKEIVLHNNLLIQLGHTMSESWFVSYVNFDDISSESRSPSVFMDEAAAKKDAQTSLSFRARLAYSCEHEFQASVKDESLYDAVDEEARQLRAIRSTMTPAEFEVKEAEIEDKRVKIKRRMAGNIRFVGELYKTKLLNTETMHDCIATLLGPPDHWKKTHDEQDLELLCRLLTTLGESLEAKSRKSKNKVLYVNFEKYFQRMDELSKDMSINSRIRFTIEEVITLRMNNWQGRNKGLEGPMKINELRQKLQEEQNVPKVPANAKGGAPPKILPRGTSTNDARNLNSGGNNKGGRNDLPAKKAPTGIVRKGSLANMPAPGKGSASPNPATAAASTPTATKKVVEEETYDFSDATQRRRADNSLKEFLNGEDASEIILSLKESSSSLRGYLLQEIMNQLCNLSDGNKRKKLMSLLDNEELLTLLAKPKNVASAALESFEPFKVLQDTVMDSRDAPVRIGEVVGKLIKCRVLDKDWVDFTVTRFIVFNKDQEFSVAEDIEAAFGRFSSTVAAAL